MNYLCMFIVYNKVYYTHVQDTIHRVKSPAENARSTHLDLLDHTQEAWSNETIKLDASPSLIPLCPYLIKFTWLQSNPNEDLIVDLLDNNNQRIFVGFPVPLLMFVVNFYRSYWWSLKLCLMKTTCVNDAGCLATLL